MSKAMPLFIGRSGMRAKAKKTKIARATKFRLNRRTFLRGSAGAAVALPWLEVMEPTSRAQAQASLPPAYIVAMTGTSFMDNRFNGSPGALGLPPSMSDLEPLRDYVSIVSDLEVPKGGSTDSPVAGGIRASGFAHGMLLAPMVTGHRHVGARDAESRTDGASSDFYVAEAIKGNTPLPSLHIRLQPNRYRKAQGRMSIREGGEREDPIDSPRAAYNYIFGSVGSNPSGPSPSTTVDRGGSVLDLVLERFRRLESNLPAWDRARVQQHMEEIRAIERRMQGVPEGPGTGGCAVPADPGPDPREQTHSVRDQEGNAGATAGWSDETTRGDVMSSLVSYAIACDLTRVSTYMISWLSSYLSMQALFNVPWVVHDVTHGPFASAVGGRAQSIRVDMTRWFTNRWGELVRKLHDLPEGDGNVLDRTVTVLLWECGHCGHNASRAHQTVDYVISIAGRPHVLHHGQHHAGGGRHPSQVLQTAMASVGVERDFGAHPGLIPGLLR